MSSAAKPMNFFIHGNDINQDVLRRDLARHFGRRATCETRLKDGRTGWFIQQSRQLSQSELRDAVQDLRDESNAAKEEAQERQLLARTNRQSSTFPKRSDSLQGTAKTIDQDTVHLRNGESASPVTYAPLPVRRSSIQATPRQSINLPTRSRHDLPQYSTGEAFFIKPVNDRSHVAPLQRDLPERPGSLVRGKVIEETSISLDRHGAVQDTTRSGAAVDEARSQSEASISTRNRNSTSHENHKLQDFRRDLNGSPLSRSTSSNRHVSKEKRDQLSSTRGAGNTYKREQDSRHLNASPRSSAGRLAVHAEHSEDDIPQESWTRRDDRTKIYRRSARPTDGPDDDDDDDDDTVGQQRDGPDDDDDDDDTVGQYRPPGPPRTVSSESQGIRRKTSHSTHEKDRQRPLYQRGLTGMSATHSKR